MAEEEKKKKKEEEKKKKAKAPSALWIRYYKSLVLFLFLVVAIVGWFVFVGPLFNQYQNIDVTSKIDELEQYDRVLSRFQTIMTEWEAVSAQEKARLDYFLPKGEDVPTLLTMVEDMAIQSGFIVTMATLTKIEQPAIENTDVYPLIVSISLEGGDYRAFKNFINKAESNLRLIDINTINFQAGSGNYIVNLASYYLNDIKQ